MSRNLTLLRAASLGSLVLATFAVWACKSEQAPKAPKSGAEDDDHDHDGDATGTATGSGTGIQQVTPTGALSLTPELPGPYTFTTGQPVRVAFLINGGTGRNLAAGVVETPPNGRVQLEPNKVTFIWDMPTNGTYNMRVLVRDLTLCGQVEVANPSLCPVPTTPVTLGLGKAYDAVSAATTITVSGTSTTGTLTGTNPGGTSGLISTISGLMGGGDLSGLLGGLSQGQLQGILSQIQGGGGMDMGSLIAMVSGMSLTSESDDYQEPEDGYGEIGGLDE